jgi:hypothetical protein
MKKLMTNYGGILIFYIIVILGVLSLCTPKTAAKSNDFKFSIVTKVAK